MIVWLRKAWQNLDAFALLIRFSYLSFTLILPLLGVATVMSELTRRELVVLIGVGVTFHIFGYVQNDIIDLTLDRTQVLRADSPLVQGTIQPWQAIILAHVQIPFALALTAWLHSDISAYLTLGLAFILGTIYNVWGKRIYFSPFTDLIQGLSWATMVLYGAFVAAEHLTEATGMVFAFITVFILLVNGVHGCLRDLTNDLNHGTHTTAILLGVRPTGNKGLFVPLRFKLYAFALEGILCAILLSFLVSNPFNYSSAIGSITATSVFAFLILSLTLPFVCVKMSSSLPVLYFMGLLHIVFSLCGLIVVFIAHLGFGLRIAILGAFILPLFRAFFISIGGLLKSHVRKAKLAQ